MRVFLFVAILLVAGPCFGGDFQVPKQAITGAEKAVPLGELADLNLTPIEAADKPKDLVAVSAAWKIFDLKTGVEKRIRSDGMGVFFGTGLQKTRLKAVCAVTYLYSVKGADGKVTEAGTRTVLLTQDVLIGDDAPGPHPNPNPDPVPNFPDGQFQLAKFAYTTATDKVAADVRAKGCAALATAFRGSASAIRAGTVKTQEEALKKANDANTAALAASLGSSDAFQDFSVSLQDNLYALYKNGKLKTVADYATAWGEIADGLEKVK